MAQLGQPDQAAELFSCLLGEPADQFSDLYYDAGNILLGAQRPAEALQYFRCAWQNCPGRSGAGRECQRGACWVGPGVRFKLAGLDVPGWRAGWARCRSRDATLLLQWAESARGSRTL
jgi:hypothetical protein